MLNPLRAIAAFLIVLCGTVGTASTVHAIEFDLSSVGPTLEWYRRATWIKVDREHRADIARREALAEQAEYEEPVSAPAVTGSCAEMAPPGFPDYIIQRESGGDPNAQNPSGAYGCAQLMPMHLTGDYAGDWARLWDGGAGACHWDPNGYCGG